MDGFLVFIVTIINIVLAISAVAIGFGLIGLALPTKGSNRAFVARLFGYGCVGAALSFVAGFVLAVLYTAVSYPILAVLAGISVLVAFYSFKKAKEHENKEKA